MLGEKEERKKRREKRMKSNTVFSIRSLLEIKEACFTNHNLL